MSDEDVRMAHHAAEENTRLAAVPAPSPQGPAPESHVEAMATAHEGRPTVAEQQKRTVYP